MIKWTEGPLRTEAGDSGEGGGGAPTADLTSTATVDTGSQTTEGLTSTSVSTGTGDWKDNLTVSDDVKNWEGFGNIKDPSDSITQLYNAQKMMGSEKMLKPQDNWTPEQWTDHYRSLGAPEAADGYEILVPESLSGVLSEDDVKSSQELYKQAGLTKKQAEILNNGGNEYAAARMEAAQAERQAGIEKGILGLQSEWGDEFGTKMDIAKAAVKKIGGDQLAATLDRLGVNQDPDLIKAFAEAGKHYMESGGGKGPMSSGMMVTTQTQASQLLKERQRDPDWSKALMEADHPAHADVVKERAELYSMAYPS
jgi:hypothetical protein